MAILLAGSLICGWIFTSSAVILYNKFIIDTLDFPYPGTIVILHQATSLVLALATCRLAAIEVPGLEVYQIMTRFVPIAALFSINLWFSNMAYIHLSVAFIQMIKAITPCLVLGFSFLIGVERVSLRLCVIIAIVSTGVMLSSLNDISVGTGVHGIVFQSVAIVAEALRLTLAKRMFEDITISPIASLIYMCPLCLAFLLVGWSTTEGVALFERGFEQTRAVSPLIFATNACTAFCLNASSMLLVKHTSALTLNICGIVKDFLLIGWSVVVSRAVVTDVQYMGYAVSTVGIVLYTYHKHAQASSTAPPPADTAAAEEDARGLLDSSDDDDA